MVSISRVLLCFSLALSLGFARQTNGAQFPPLLHPDVNGGELVIDGITNVLTPGNMNLRPLLSVGEPPSPITYEADADGIIFTGVESHLAIRGAGWFAVKDVPSQTILYTRFGDFRIDANGYLVTAQGYRLQGVMTFGRPDIGDLQINNRLPTAEGDPGASVIRLEFLPTGELQLGLSDGTKLISAQVLLQYFGAVERLQRIDAWLFGRTAAALPAPTLAAPGANGLGQIVGQSLEGLPTGPTLVSLESENGSPLLRGGLTRTGRAADLAIRGPGAFLVRDPITSELFATRAGMFLVDSNGILITYDRKRLLGYPSDGNGSLSELSIYAPPHATTHSDATVVHFTVGRDGSLNMHHSDGTEHVAGWIACFDFRRPARLRAARLGQYAGVTAAQPVALAEIGGWHENATEVEQGGLELVNVTPDLLALRRRLSFFTQGALYQTESATDLAVDGEGFFLVEEATTGRTFATRNGEFRQNLEGYLVNRRGFYLLGWPDVSTAVVGRLRIPDLSFQIERNGWMVAQPANGPEALRGQILLASFREPFLLRPLRDGLFGNLDAAQLRSFAEPGTHSSGQIESRALEIPPEAETLVLPLRDGFRFLIIGNSSVRWKVTASYDQRNWQTLGIIEPAGGEFEYCDHGRRPHQNRYYRVMAEYAEPRFNRPDLQMSNVLTNAPEWDHCLPRKSRR